MSRYFNAQIPSLPYEIQQLNPLGTKVLIEVFEREEFSEGGILLDTANYYSPSNRGTVIAAGEDVAEEIQLGDIVLFPWQKGDDFECEGCHILILEQADIQAKLELDGLLDSVW